MLTAGSMRREQKKTRVLLPLRDVRGKPVHGKLTHVGREVVASAVMLQEAVASATTVGRLQNEKKRLVEQLNKETENHEAAEKLSA
jgi:hypothetical protein